MKIQVCTGGSCKSKFSEYIIKRLENDIEKFRYKKLDIERTGCMGKCKYGPNVKLNNGDMLQKSEPAKISQLARNELTKKK